MSSMESNTTPVVFISLLLTVSYLTTVNAVTDAELDALEKQLEQMETEEKEQAEAEEKKKAEAEAKRRADQKRKANAEAERKRLAELEKQRIEEEKRLAGETKIREKEEKKEKYTRLITEAEQAYNDRDKVLAIKKYNEALTLSPGDSVANTGIRNAEKLKHKVCYEIVGTWRSEYGETYDINEDGTTGPINFPWKCTNPENRTFEMEVPLATMIAVLSDDGNCIKASTWASTVIWNRVGHTCKVAQQEESVKQNPIGL